MINFVFRLFSGWWPKHHCGSNVVRWLMCAFLKMGSWRIQCSRNIFVELYSYIISCSSWSVFSLRCIHGYQGIFLSGSGTNRTSGVMSNIPSDGTILPLLLMGSCICQQWHMEPVDFLREDLARISGFRSNIPSDGGILPVFLMGSCSCQVVAQI